jgi:hypothetical protein
MCRPVPSVPTRDATGASRSETRDDGADSESVEASMTSADGTSTTAAVAARAELLHETATHHGSFEAVAPPHDWWDWYAAYMLAREAGSSPDEAAAAAGRYMAEVKQVVVPSA